MTGRDTDRNMRCILLKAALRAGPPTGIHWDVEPTGTGRTPRRSKPPHPAFKRLRTATRAAARAGSLRPAASVGTPPLPPAHTPSSPFPDSGDVPPPPPPSLEPEHETELEPRRSDPREPCRRLGVAMLSQTRTMHMQYDAMVKLENISERREILRGRMRDHRWNKRLRSAQQNEAGSEESYSLAGLGEEVVPPPPSEEDDLTA